MIPLARARLCLERACAPVIFDGAVFRVCPGCGSAQTAPVEQWLLERDKQAYEARTIRELAALGAA